MEKMNVTIRSVKGTFALAGESSVERLYAYVTTQINDLLGGVKWQLSGIKIMDFTVS